MSDFGFIITRHVNSEQTNRYWNHSLKLLKMFYPDKKIIIIDDNSNEEFIKSDFDYDNVEIVHSEFPGSGELLPYYYYLKNKYFENAVILHDSVFFHKRIPFEVLYKLNVLPLWHFNPDRENNKNTFDLIQNLKNVNNIEKKVLLKEDFISWNNNNKWFGCFGVQSYINYNFLSYINNKYNLLDFIKYIKNRKDRCCLERIIGCIFFTEDRELHKNISLFGNIRMHHKWRMYTFEQYENDLKKGTVPRAVVKIWTGR